MLPGITGTYCNFWNNWREPSYYTQIYTNFTGFYLIPWVCEG